MVKEYIFQHLTMVRFPFPNSLGITLIAIEQCQWQSWNWPQGPLSVVLVSVIMQMYHSYGNVSWDWRRLVMKSFYDWKCSMQMYRIISLRSHFSLFVSLFFNSASFLGILYPFIVVLCLCIFCISAFLFLDTNRFVSPCLRFFSFSFSFSCLSLFLNLSVFLCGFVSIYSAICVCFFINSLQVNRGLQALLSGKEFQLNLRKLGKLI